MDSINCDSDNSSCFSVSDSNALSLIQWTETIHDDQLSMHRVTDTRDRYFHAICMMYELDEETLAKELNAMVLWCICDKQNEPIGAVQLDYYSSLEALRAQVSDNELSTILFSKGKVLELSCELKENYRGQGLGSRAAKRWLAEADQNGWGKYLFAVVDETNKPSIRILEKAFTYMGKYIHSKTEKRTLVYTLSEKSFQSA